VRRYSATDCRYFFWSGAGSRDGHIKTLDESLKAVFRASGVEKACAHRFRHTLATDILLKGGDIRDAANVLGDSPAIIEKHYLKWTAAYQARTAEILSRVHGTPVARVQKAGVTPEFSIDGVVPEVGLEPTRTVKCAGF
jgi:site-specific recombinase XerD